MNETRVFWSWQTSRVHPQAEEDKWVTVYGLQGGDEASILREFQKCGTIVQFGSGRDDRVNWTHIMYSVRLLNLHDCKFCICTDIIVEEANFAASSCL